LNNEYQDLIAFLGRKFEEIDRRFEAIDRRFDRVDAKLAEHDERFGEVLGHFDGLYRRLERLEDEYHAIVQGLRRVETLLTDEKGKREVLERNLEELKQHVAALQVRIEAVEQRLHG
jgi:chromosome segregation ATPase